MRRIILLLILLQISLINYSQIIANHTIVDMYDDIPQYYINLVKTMWLSIPGESHATAYTHGLELLKATNSIYSVNVTWSGSPEAYTTTHLRASNASWGDYSNSAGWINDDYGEEDWFTNATAISRTKAGLLYCKSINLSPSAMGFGWCTDMHYGGFVSPSVDPVYECHWMGQSINGPQGNLAWGLDNGDYAITGNTVNIDTYLNVTQQYIDYCNANNISTKIFFTTGPVDGHIGEYTAEGGYGAYLKMQRIRDYVKADPARILFDYADILCYDDAGNLTTSSWNGHSFPMGTPANVTPEYVGHITANGCTRLAKALWWMLARIAGWDGGSTTVIPVTGITVTGAGGATTITSDKGTLQLSATVTPSTATNKAVTWSVSNGTGQAIISSSGLVTAVATGTITARATANDGSGIYGTLIITISNQVIPVTGITVTGAGGATTITSDKGTLQLSATVTPSTATNKAVTWSVSNGTGQAIISSSGLVTAVATGTITARATANDGSGIYGTLVITISKQVIQAKSIIVTSSKGTTSISIDDGTLQLTATISPSDATNQTVSWSIINETGQASINSSGLVTAISNGTVNAQAIGNDGSGVFGSMIISISNQIALVSGIIVTGENGVSTITEENGILQLYAATTPTSATNQTVNWSILNGTGQASISTTGLVTAISSGNVSAMATANDGSGAEGILKITIIRRSSEQLTIIMGENEIRIPLDESYSNSTLSIYDLQGHLIKSQLVDSDLIVFNTSNLGPGLYIAKLSKSMILKVGKFIKK